jgi:hypothetical protein
VNSPEAMIAKTISRLSTMCAFAFLTEDGTMVGAAANLILGPTRSAMARIPCQRRPQARGAEVAQPASESKGLVRRQE